MSKSKKTSVEKMLKTLKEILELSCDVGDLQRASTIRSTIELITQLHSDNERLVRDNKILSENADTAFQDGLNEAQDLYADQIRQEIRTETCKECLKKFEKNMKDVKVTLGQTWEIQNALKKTLKEMTGEDNDRRQKAKSRRR